MTESLLWLIYVVVLLVPAGGGHRWVALAIAIGAAAAAPIFWFALGDAKSAIFIVAAAVAGLSAWYANEATRVELLRVEAERVALSRKAAALQVREDQLRIARELHDGIGAHLAALVWRTQRLQRRAGAALEAPIRRLNGVAVRALGELRTTVWTLHSPMRPWPEVVELLQTRLGDRPMGAATVVDESGPETGTRLVPAERAQALLRELAEAPAGARVGVALEAEAVRATVEASGAEPGVIVVTLWCSPGPKELALTE